MSTRRSLARYLVPAVLLAASLLLVACGGAGPMPTSPAATPAPSVQATQPAATPPPPPTSRPTVAKTLNVLVKGTHAIYLAGRDDVTIPPLGADDPAFPLLRCGGELALETRPPAITIGPEATFTFQVTGLMDYYGSDTPAIGPDSDVEAPSGVESLAGISGYSGPQGALVGLFLGDENPAGGAAPELLDFSETGVGTSFERLEPGLGQVFFIGDGRAGTGVGAAQTFAAPTGATRLFLGTVDAVGFSGPPGCYGDDTGAFQAVVTSSAPLSLGSAGSQGSPGGASATPPAAGASEAKPTIAAPATAAKTSTATAQATAAKTSTAAAQATAAKTPTAQAESTSAAGLASGPTSYRIHTVTRLDDAQGDIKEDGLVEAVVDPLAFHQKVTGDVQMEVVVIGHILWAKFAELPWRQTDLAEGDLQAQLQQLSGTESPMNIQEQTPLEGGIAWLLGQESLQMAKGSLKPAGQETVNGVACKRYTVDSTYTYTVEMTTPTKVKATVTSRVQGEIWVADKAEWSPFVVRERVTQNHTTQAPAGASTKTEYIEQDVTDINQAITIKPPQ